MLLGRCLAGGARRSVAVAVADGLPGGSAGRDGWAAGGCAGGLRLMPPPVLVGEPALIAGLRRPDHDMDLVENTTSMNRATEPVLAGPVISHAHLHLEASMARPASPGVPGNEMRLHLFTGLRQQAAAA